MPEESRSSSHAENLGDLLSAAGAGNVNAKGQAQYFTPSKWADLFARLLPRVPRDVFDPQFGEGALVNSFNGSTRRHGVEIDSRFAGRRSEHGSQIWTSRIHGSCVEFWSILDDFFPDLRLECQVANPPFGLRWKLPKATPQAEQETVDSVEYTWRKITERAAPGGFGYFICGRGQMERLGIDKHPWVYLLSTFPAEMFPGVSIEIACVHWHNSESRFRANKERVHLHFGKLDPEEHEVTIDGIDAFHLRQSLETIQAIPPADTFAHVERIIDEDRHGRPEFNVYLWGGVLQLRIDHRTMLGRKLDRYEVERVARVNDCHPLTLVQETETRRMLENLVKWGLTLQPAAQAAIEDALRQAASMARPILPVTPFEMVAYADDMEQLTARPLPLCTHRIRPSTSRGAARFSVHGITLTARMTYPLKTATYEFKEQFVRKKVHYNEESGHTYPLDHQCSLTGQDRYIEIIDDLGLKHRFMDRPDPDRSPSKVAARVARQQAEGSGAGQVGDYWCEHPETLLWDIFEQPEVKTLADTAGDEIAGNRRRLLQFAATVTA